MPPGTSALGCHATDTLAECAEGPAAPDAAARLLGSRIGHIRVLDELGRGGMGSVFAGFDEKLERRVAIKAIQGGSLGSEGRARFLREARILSQLRHPRICQIHEYVAGDEQDFLVLELIDGRDLGAAIQEGLTEGLRWRVAEQIAGVLAAAHDRSIIHRDLKPQNVMLTRDGEVKVLDFGIARAVHAEAAPRIDGARGDERCDADGEGPVTELGVVVGTLAYMSPEQARGEALTTASDMYAYGLLLQELFTGRPASEPGLPPAEQLLRAQAGATRPVHGVSAELWALIQRLKSLSPAARPSAVDTLERLRWIREAPRRRRRRVGAAAGFVTVALVAVGMTLQAWRVTREAERANREAESARHVSELLVGLFEAADPDKNRSDSVTVREALDNGAAKVERDLAGRPLVQALMLHTLGAVYYELGVYSRSRALHEKALALREAGLGPEHVDVAETLEELGGVYLRLDDPDRAERVLDRALAIRRRSGEEPPRVAALLSDLADVHEARGNPERALALHAQGLAIQERSLDPDDRDIAETLYKLAALHRESGELARAEAELARAAVIFERQPSADPESQQWRDSVGGARESLRKAMAAAARQGGMSP